MESGTTNHRERIGDNISLDRKIRTIRIILLGIVLFVWTDAVGKWFTPSDQSTPGIFLVLEWVLCLGSSAALFHLTGKPEKNVFKWIFGIIYYIIFIVLLIVCGYYNYQSEGTIGYKISTSLMPAVGILIEIFHPRFIKWYGNLLKRVFKLDGIRNVTFAIGMLVFYALVVIIGIGMYRIPGCLQGYGRDIVQLVTEGEINHNQDCSEPRLQYRNIFNDRNDVQLEAAKNNGIKEFVNCEDDVRNFRLRKIESCDYYHVQKLTHSLPYLTPKASRLLEDMGKAFQDSLFNRGYNSNHRFTVTSLLRTPDSVKKLQKTNVNSSSNSCHCYGTTFDISYRTFQTPLRGKKASVEKMNQILMEVAYDMRRQNRCYVKYEKQQTCLHITVR
ncbi:MAG: DUF5715 family protein [Bacteroidaceae bacterium]|nr:DUF5715 family protein [Bacteroidaceae bacterium]